MPDDNVDDSFRAPKRDALAMLCLSCEHATMSHQSFGCGHAQLRKIPKTFKPRGVEERAADGFKPLEFKEYCECEIGFDTLLMVAEGFHRLREVMRLPD